MRETGDSRWVLRRGCRRECNVSTSIWFRLTKVRRSRPSAIYSSGCIQSILFPEQIRQRLTERTVLTNTAICPGDGLNASVKKFPPDPPEVRGSFENIPLVVSRTVVSIDLELKRADGLDGGL